MPYRLVLDEHVEHDLYHRLKNYGHDVEHIDFIPNLGKGANDGSIAQYSLDTDRVILTYDDDFVIEFDEEEYFAVLYVGDAMLPVKQVADIVHSVSQSYPQEDLNGLEYVGKAWL